MVTITPKISKKVSGKELLRITKKNTSNIESIKFTAPKIGKVGDFGSFLIVFDVQ
jgi:hypothetical protein